MNATPIEPQNVTELVQNIFDSMLQLQCDPAEPKAAEAIQVDQSNQLIGIVQIQGDWNGAVEVHTSVDFGRKAASAMMMMPEDDVSESDIQDVVAELSNMVGGSIKGILPGKSRLSIPSVASGAGLEVKMSNVLLNQEIALDCQGHEFSIEIKHCAQ